MSASSARPITDADCEQWRQNPIRNPHTGYPITANGPTYNRYRVRCGQAPPRAPQPLGQPQQPTPQTPQNQVRRENQTQRLFRVMNSLQTGAPISADDVESVADSLSPQTLQQLIDHLQRQSEQQTPAQPAQQTPPAQGNVARRLDFEGEALESSSSRRRRSSQRTPGRSPAGVGSQPAPPQVINIAEIPGFEEEKRIFRIQTISRYEVSRFIANRLVAGLNTYIDPVFFSLKSIQTNNVNLRPFFEEICRRFGISYAPQPFISNTHSRSVGRSTHSFTTDELDRIVAHPIRTDANIIYNNRIVDSSAVTPTSIFNVIVKMALNAGLDIYPMQRRSPDTQPILSWESINNTLYQTVYNKIQRGLLPLPPARNFLPFPLPPTFSTVELVQESSSPSKPIYASLDASPTDVAPQCVDQLTNFQEPFKKLGRKLKVMCTDYSKQCDNLESLKNTLQQELNRLEQRHRIHRNFRNITPEYVIAEIFKRWVNLPSSEDKKNIMLFNHETGYYDVSYRGQSGVGPGVRRSFIQRLLDELVEYGFFTPSRNESNVRYFINPQFTPDANFKRISGKNFSVEAHYEELYTFIGHLLTFIVMNNVGIKIKLSYNILAHMLYKHDEITDDDYIGYGMMDFPSEFNGFINLMKNPDTIEYAMLGFNDSYPLKPEDEEVISTNFREYLRALYKYRYLHKVHPEDQMTGGSSDTYNRLLAMTKGMHSIRKYLRNANVTIPALDSLITSSGVDATTVQQLKANFIRTVEQPEINERRYLQQPGLSAQERQRIQSSLDNRLALKSKMVLIFDDNGENLPYEEMGMERPEEESKRKEAFYRFIENLLMFWTSYRQYTPRFNYYIAIKNPEDLTAGRQMLNRGRTLTQQQRMGLLPESHTCFQTIDIPNTYHDSFEILYKKLVQASGMAEAGIGNYGGKSKSSKSKDKSKHKSKHVSKEKTKKKDKELKKK